MHHLRHALALAFLIASPALADDANVPVTTTVSGSFEDVMFDVEIAIAEAGLVVDTVNNVGEMLERTKDAVGATRTIFTHAKVFTFCSAEVSRAVMEADPLNLHHCPYRIFVSERPEAPGQITIGHTRFPAGVTDQINALLDGIIAEALTDY